MNVWFGTSWGAIFNDHTPQVPVPVGASCLWCDEPIAAHESGWGQCVNGPFMHVECFMRQMLGSVGHQLKLCGCYGGDALYDGDNPEMSRRDSARAAWEMAMSKRPSGQP
jgi:hypothetical protein